MSIALRHIHTQSGLDIPVHRKLRRNNLWELRALIRHGRRTTIRLELEFWDALDDICDRERLTFQQICDLVDWLGKGDGLTSALRVLIMRYVHALSDSPFGRANVLEEFVLEAADVDSSVPWPGGAKPRSRRSGIRPG